MPPQRGEPGAATDAPAWWNRWIEVRPAASADDAPVRDPFQRYTRWFLAALLVVVAARFVRLDIDPPYGVLAGRGVYLSDEGWYTQSAQLRAAFGTWTNEYDMVWFSHNALFSFLQSVAFRVAGVSPIVARTFSVLCFCVTVGSFYLILRSVQTRTIALATCLLGSVSLYGFAHSRMAIVEPTGTAVSMLALLAWVRLPRGFPACAAGLLLAGASYFVKASFIFTIAVMVALALGEIVVLVRERRRPAAAAVLAAIVAVPLLMAAVQHAINGAAPEQAAMFASDHVDWRVNAVFGGSNPLYRELKLIGGAILRLPRSTGALALGFVILVGLPLIFLRAKRRIRVPRSRAVIALLLWLIGATTFFGLFQNQPIRYFYFASFPLALMAVTVLRELVPITRWPMAVFCLLLVQATVQVPGFAKWLGRDDLTTADTTSRDVIARMDLDAAPGAVGVVGDLAPLLAMHDARIRPFKYRPKDGLSKRLDRWRPGFLFDFPSRAEELRSALGKLIERVDCIATYRIMNDDDALGLYRIVYRR